MSSADLEAAAAPLTTEPDPRLGAAAGPEIGAGPGIRDSRAPGSSARGTASRGPPTQPGAPPGDLVLYTPLVVAEPNARSAGNESLWQGYLVVPGAAGAGPAELPALAASGAEGPPTQPGAPRRGGWGARTGRAKPGAAPRAVKESRPTWPAGKNAGKKNATTPLGQALLELWRAWKKRAGAREREGTVLLPMLVGTPGLGGAPTLAEFLTPDTIVQRKYNGTRALAVRAVGQADEAVGQADEADGAAGSSCAQPPAAARGVEGAQPPAQPLAVLLTRTGREIRGQPTLRAEAAALLARLPAEYAALDLELYTHGCDLGAISGSSRREGDDSLAGVVFDLVPVPAPAGAAGAAAPEGAGPDAATRQEDLRALFAGTPPLSRLEAAPARRLGDLVAGDLVAGGDHAADLERAVADELAAVLAEGYEGLVLRDPASPYLPRSLRSRAVLKVKPLLDAEFPLVGFKAGKGAAEDVVIWRLRAPDGEFDVVPVGPQAERADVLRRLRADPALFERVRGRPVRVEFFEYSKGKGRGVPTQPRALGFVAEPGDPCPVLFPE